MEQELKLPAQYAALSPEEQVLASGGAPAWMKEFTADVKEKLRPYKPYLDYAWEVTLVGMACINEAYQAYSYGKIILASLKGIRDCVKSFPW